MNCPQGRGGSSPLSGILNLGYNMSKIINSLDEVLEVFRQTFNLSKEQMAWILQDRAFDLLVDKGPVFENTTLVKYSYARTYDGVKVGHDYSDKEAYLTPNSNGSGYVVEHRKLSIRHYIYGPSINETYNVNGVALTPRAINIFKDMIKKLEA